MRINLPPVFTETDAIGSANNDVLHLTAVYFQKAADAYRAQGNIILANDAERRAKNIMDKLSWKSYFNYY